MNVQPHGPIMKDQFFFEQNGTALRLCKNDDDRWSLFCNNHEVCTYSSPERAALFVFRGITGNSLIDRMVGRPQAIEEWQSR